MDSKPTIEISQDALASIRDELGEKAGILAQYQAIYKAIAPQVKRDGDGLRAEVDKLMLQNYMASGAKSYDVYLPGYDKPVGTISGKLTERKPTRIDKKLQVVDKLELIHWIRANVETVVEFLVYDRPEYADDLIGWALMTRGEIPEGCEFLDYVSDEGSPGGQWVTRLVIKDDAVTAAITAGAHPVNVLSGGLDG